MKTRRIGPWQIFWLLAGALFFLVPLYGTLEYSLEVKGGYGFKHYLSVLQDSGSPGFPGFKDAFLYSLKIAAGTVAIGVALMVPTVYWVNLKLPRVRKVIDFIAVLPFVVPPVALAVGINRLLTTQPSVVLGQPQRISFWLVSRPLVLVLAYVILALPFTYRSLDAGMRAIDLHTLTEAAQSVGAGWTRVLFSVILPNIRYAMLSAAFLTITLVLGEYTMSSLLLFNTFAVYVEYTGEAKANPAAALAIISFALTWAAMLGILLLGRGVGRRQGQLTGTR
jgi:putative spermidine/putrescine transport system permease protein